MCWSGGFVCAQLDNRNPAGNISDGALGPYQHSEAAGHKLQITSWITLKQFREAEENSGDSKSVWARRCE